MSRRRWEEPEEIKHDGSVWLSASDRLMCGGSPERHGLSGSATFCDFVTVSVLLLSSF